MFIALQQIISILDVDFFVAITVKVVILSIRFVSESSEGRNNVR